MNARWRSAEVAADPGGALEHRRRGARHDVVPIGDQVETGAGFAAALDDQHGQPVRVRLDLALADREALSAGPGHLRPLAGPGRKRREQADARRAPAERVPTAGAEGQVV